MLGSSLHRRKEGRIKIAVLQHEAHRAFFDLGAIEGQEERRRPLPGTAVRLALIFRIGCALSARRGPDADHRQQPLRGDGQRIGPPVKPGLGPRRGRARVDHRHAQARPAPAPSAKAGPFSPPPTIRISASCVMPVNYGARRGIVHAPPCRYLASEATGVAMSENWLWHDGGRSGARHRGGQGRIIRWN